MPGNSTGGPQKSRPHTQPTGRPGPDCYRQGRLLSWDSNTSQESYREHCVDQPLQTKAQQARKAHPRLANGRESETLGFIPGSADSPSATQACGPCSSFGWGSCRALLCCVLTCGFYGSREPCLPASETSTDDPPKVGPGRTSNGTTVSQTTRGINLEPPKASKLRPSESFIYQDVRIGGKEVVFPGNSGAPPRRSRQPGSRGDSQRPISNTSIYSREELDLDELSDSGTDIDSLITKKLLELYKLHQIDQLAKCTSDSSFSRKTNEISELINSIAQDYNLEEQEAECRLVHGVIRISTRKSKRGPHIPKDRESASQEAGQRASGRRDGTLPDSGNETMTDTFHSNETEPEVKVSEQTPSDELARKMRLNSGRGSSSGLPTAYSHYRHETETDLSGAPLLHLIRT